jgi:hypothetical protein
MTDQFDNIDAYLKNELSINDKKMFEQQMSNDSSLAEAVQQQRVAMKLVEVIGDKELKSQIKNALQKRDQTNATVRSIKPRWQLIAGIAASLLIIVVAAWFLMNKPSNEALFASNYEVYKLNVNSRDNNLDENIRQAVRLYESANYMIALPLFNDIYKADKDSKWLIAQSIGMIELNQFQPAVDILANVRANDQDAYQGPALWYTAMAYLKLDQREKAIENIKVLSSRNTGAYAKKAKEFLEKN